MIQGDYKNRSFLAKYGGELAVGSTIVAIVTGLILFYQTSGIRGVYGNKVSEYLLTKSGRQQEVAWLRRVDNNFNSYCGYGMSKYVKSNPADVRDFIIRARRSGVKGFGYIYGATGFQSTLSQYQKGCTNDSARFNFVISEIEQYQPGGDPPGFYKTLREVNEFCRGANMKSFCYQGWGSQPDFDTIVKYCDQIYLHAYLKYDKYPDVGAAVYGYIKTRVRMIESSVERIRPGEKYPIVIILSTENPDQTKTQFGYKYYLVSGWGDPFTSFLRYNRLRSEPIGKKNILFAGFQIFVEDQAKKIKT